MSVGKGFMLKRFLTAVACISVLVVPLSAWSNPVNSGPKAEYTVATSAPDYSWRHQITTAPKPVEVYKVRRDDTLSGIARKFDLSWKKLYCANKKTVGSDPNVLQVHIKLKIRESKRVWCNISPPNAKAASVNTTPVQTTSTPVQSTTQSSKPYLGGSSFQQCVIMAESGGDPTAYNPASGASGLYGFLLSTWDSLGLGYPGGAYTAPVSVQNEGFAILYARDGTSPWAPYDGC